MKPNLECAPCDPYSLANKNGKECGLVSFVNTCNQNGENNEYLRSDGTCAVCPGHKEPSPDGKACVPGAYAKE